MIFSPVTVFELKSWGGPVALPSPYRRMAGREFDKSSKKFFFNAFAILQGPAELFTRPVRIANRKPDADRFFSMFLFLFRKGRVTGLGIQGSKITEIHRSKRWFGAPEGAPSASHAAVPGHK
jgi:hypothetical protein